MKPRRGGRSSLKPVVIAAATALAVLPVAVAGPARAASGPSLGGWNVAADANVVDIVFDNATGLAGVHPFTEADFPEAQSQFATGPFGSGLATVFWPGGAGGNFGSLSSELGFPSQLEPLASQLNDPVRPAPSTPRDPAGPATRPAPRVASPKCSRPPDPGAPPPPAPSPVREPPGC